MLLVTCLLSQIKLTAKI